MTALTYRLASGETWTLTPDAAGVELVGECAPDGLHVVLTRDDAIRLIYALSTAVRQMEE